MNKKRILIADDDPAIIDALEFMLTEAGYAVDTTIDGSTIAKMFDDKPDLLILDIWMSGMNGSDICKALKAQSQTQRIPIIMVSANKDTRDIAHNAGADDFLEKPFEMKDLLNKVKKYLEN